MMTVSEQLRRSESGFTLVELMVVVLIVGILVTVAFPVFTAAQNLARERACQANLRTIDGAIEQWQADAVANDAAALEGAEPFDVLENAVGIEVPAESAALPLGRIRIHDRRRPCGLQPRGRSRAHVLGAASRPRMSLALQG